jgi:hypothetical protein
MKNLLFAFALCIVVTNVSASHLMGGQITVKQISGLDYQIVMQLYRDTTGIPISPTATFQVEEVNGTAVTQITVPHNGAVHFFNGVELYEYSSPITFLNGGLWRISWEDCCRNPAILNMGSPASESLNLMTEVTVDPLGQNSTPDFLNAPATLAERNVLWQYNPLPFDPDGDSLSWVAEIPLGASGVQVAGYVLPHADPINPFTLDPLTGEVTWWPDVNGHWEASFRVEEYRNGVKIGEIRRDMQIIVDDDTTNYHFPVFGTGSWPTDPNGNYAMMIPPGGNFNLSVTSTDLDNDALTMSVQGEPMILPTNPAQFSVTNSAPGTVTGQFSWTPLASQERSQPYILAFRINEQHGLNTYSHDQTLLLYVNSNAGIEQINSNSINARVYPNPSDGNWSLSFNLGKKSNVTVEIIDMTGKLVTNAFKGELSAGTNLIRNTDSKLSTGNYLLNILVDGQKAFTTPLTIK